MLRRAASAPPEGDSLALTENVMSLREFSDAGGIFTFCGMRHEPDTSRIIKNALRLGKRVYVPRCNNGGLMEAVAIRSMEDLASSGAFGIPEPGECLKAAAREDIDLVLVPGLCFDRSGGRLGRGKGYYDRFLYGLKAVFAGLCVDELLMDAVPMEPHDIKMDIIVTQSQIIRISEAMEGSYVPGI